MDKQRARQLYELADRLSKLDVNTLSEEQKQQRSTMIAKLQEEVKEGIVDADKEPSEYDQEGDMARQDLATAADAANELRSILTSDENLPEWVQSKITKAVDYLDTVRDYMKSKDSTVTETKVKPTEFVNKNPKLTPVNIKKSDTVSEEINTEAYERLQKVFAFKNYES